MDMDMGCPCRHIRKKALNLCIYYHSLFMFIIHMPCPVVRYGMAAFRLT
nr:MAG TPA: conotoxin [Caudoviricetes sp.]